MNTAEIKSQARRFGADLVGVAAADRWADWPAGSNPRSILPSCQSVVVLGRRILRGSFRGVEEGTSFSNTYGMYGAHWQEHEFLSRVIQETAGALESAGAEAVPLFGGSEEGRVRLDARALAREAGLGSVGRGGFFLTPRYGHRQRFGLILTDQVLEGDPVADVSFCAGCDACLRACPLQAMSDTGPGPFARDARLCQACANGRITAFPASFERLDRLAASCGRACLVALEQKVGNRFQAPFRKRSVWTRDLDGRPQVHPLPSKGA